VAKAEPHKQVLWEAVAVVAERTSVLRPLTCPCNEFAVVADVLSTAEKKVAALATSLQPLAPPSWETCVAETDWAGCVGVGSGRL